MLRKATLILGATTGALTIVGVIGMNAVMREAAMTSCPPLVPAKADTTVSVETRYLPWKFTCVYSRGGRTVARHPSPYSPQWPWN
jgi:hypothetical protein